MVLLMYKTGSQLNILVKWFKCKLSQLGKNGVLGKLYDLSKNTNLRSAIQ